ncbi:hypothetical protein J2X24_003013 [Asticcacaulis solisilvae]|nr:hypothetical protein [Asticcacaulis solisilvae]MDR6801480.1 hypothetical protein [Asticcacaulis sp. BE141]
MNYPYFLEKTPAILKSVQGYAVAELNVVD